jgi:hypothetical protein
MGVLPDRLGEPSAGTQLTGSRIRERRLQLGLKQAALAEAVGISASYLNLIEHNRRRIGGKLLVQLAGALGVDAGFLSEGADATVRDTLQSAARMASRGATETFGPAPEITRIDDLAARYPGWTGLIALQQKRIQGLEALVESLRDRLAHDPVLAEAMHEILSSVAAIRSTADILAREKDLDGAWLGRFHRNLHEEAERLSARATAMLGHFEAPDARGETLSATPVETVEAMFDAAGHHFPEIEQLGAAAIPAILARGPGTEDAATRALAEGMLARYADDAARLPLDRLLPAARAAGFDPGALLHLGAGDVALVLRRLASLPPGEAAPAFGLAVCDASGALLFRRRIASFSIPRFGPGCPLWPLYAALVRPGHPDTAVMEMPQGNRFRAWAVAQPVAQTGFGMAPVVQATMLIAPLAADTGPDLGRRAVLAGPGCSLCPRKDCPARR